MTWAQNGDAHCDNACGAVYLGETDRHAVIQRMRAARWHHAQGNTIGGAPYEAILCPKCAKDERKRRRDKPSIKQEALPLSWEEYRRNEQAQGFQSR